MISMEREKGFEPSTLALARRCSTTELFPHVSDNVAEVTRVWRAAIDHATSSSRYAMQPAWAAQLSRWAEGQQHTLGAYERSWR